MNAAEFALAVEAMLEQAQASTALGIVDSDLGEVETAKQRGRWHAFLEARNIIIDARKALTEDPAGQPAQPEKQEALY